MMTLLMGAAAVTSILTAPGPSGPLEGTMIDVGAKAPVVLIIPGSGPTDRDGNNPLGITSASYRLLAEGLSAQGVSSVRIDKRGMFGSKNAVKDGNAVTLGDYAADAHAWARSIRDRTKAKCVWLLGHSEGGLVALTAAQQPKDICGVVLVSAPGQKLGDVMRAQLRANPANAPILDAALAAIGSFEAGKRVDVSAMHPALQQLFAPQVQGFLIDVMAADPVKLAKTTKLPMLIVHGGKDFQIGAADAKAFADAGTAATRLTVDDMTHALKAVEGDDRAANMATYADPSRPVHPRLVDAVARFVKRP